MNGYDKNSENINEINNSITIVNKLLKYAEISYAAGLFGIPIGIIVFFWRFGYGDITYRMSGISIIICSLNSYISSIFINGFAHIIIKLSNIEDKL